MTDEKNALLDAYDQWLANERAALHRQRYADAGPETLRHVPETPAGAFHLPPRDGQETPAERAAVVLDCVGARWRETDADEVTLNMPGAGEEEAPLPALTEAELDEIFSDEGINYDFTIRASIAGHQSAWRELLKIRTATEELAPGPSRDRILETVDVLESWFMTGIERLVAMAAADALRKDGGAP
jgi:hypothetical protein